MKLKKPMRIKTIDEYTRQSQAMLEKSPELKTFQLFSAREFAYEALSDFIETCFTYDFGDETRIRFTPGFLRWNMPEKTGTVLCDGTRIIGCVLSFQESYIIAGEKRKFATETALAVDPAYRSMKIGQYVAIQNKIKLIQDGFDFAVHWLDSRHRTVGSSYRIFGRNPDRISETHNTKLWGKSFDFVKAKKNGDLGAGTAFVLWGLEKLFPSRPTPGFSKKYEIHQFNPDEIKDYKRFFNSCCEGLNIHRDYADVGFSKQLDFHDQGLDTVFFSAQAKESGGGIYAIAYGYNQSAENKDTITFWDGIMVHPDMPKKDAVGFISGCEALLKAKYGSIAATKVFSSANISFFNGYAPYADQTVGIDYYADIPIGFNDLKNIGARLR